jgi:DnaK suppressor protein
MVLTFRNGGEEMNSTIRTSGSLQLRHFKAILDAHRDETLDRLRRSEAEQRGLDRERPAEAADFCVESAGREDLFERISNQRRLLQRIEAALRRIEYGTFGECTACGGEIKPKRMEIMPWTEYCVRCQEDFERAAVSRATWSAVHRAQRGGR